MPSPNFVYVALLYKDGESPVAPPSEDFVKGTKAEDSDKLIFSFQRPDETDGFTLEVFAFKADMTNFSKDNALLSGKKTGLKVNGDKIEVVETIALEVNEKSEAPGTVSLRIKVPSGCSLEIDDTANFTKSLFLVSDFIITHKDASGISAGTYPVTFSVKKNGVIIHEFTEYINVLPGLCTDTWGGQAKGAAKEITQDMASTTVYVRGAAGWYATSDYNTTATADDDNSGSFLSPLATIQKAVDTIIARNDGTSEYTIYIDGTLQCDDGTCVGENGMADFSKFTKDLNLTIKALSGMATLDGGARLDANGNVTNAGIEKRVIYAKPTSGKLELTFDNLTITGGKLVSENGAGIYFESAGGTLTMNGGEISGNIGDDEVRGGGVYVGTGKFIMDEVAVSGNSTGRGAGIYVDTGGTVEMNGGSISNNNAIRAGGGFGGGVYVCAGEFTMNNGTIEGNTATLNGGGVSIGSGGTFTMKGDTSTISGNNASDSGGGVCIAASGGTFTMEGGTISGNEAAHGGGVCNNDIFTMKGSAFIPAGNDGKNDVYLAEGKTICITGELTATTTPVATITPSAYEENRSLLSAGDGVTLNGGICNQFAVTSQNNGDDTNTEWRVALDGADGVLIRKYALRSAGPGDGVVCYYNVEGFTVNGKTCHYLECSKDRIGSVTWCPCTDDSGYCEVTTSTGIGAGYANTQAILAHPSHASATASNCAAKACAEYKTDTTTAGEWFLPSHDEGYRMNVYIPITVNESLWASNNSIYDADGNDKAGYVMLSPNGSSFSSGGWQKKASRSVWAVRAF